MISKKQETRREWWKLAGLYTIAFAVVAALILWCFLSQGKAFMRMVDGVGQHYAVLCYIREYIREFFATGSLPMVDFSIGQGFDVIGTLSYYGFGDPLTLLTALFPDNALEAMYAFFIFLRLYLAGLAFSGYCFAIGRREKAFALSGSLLYVFCNFALYAGMTHPFFLNGVLYLPLLLIGIERILQKKGILVLAVTVAGSFLSNYYFMYMNTVLVGIYLLIRLVGRYRSLKVKGFLQIVGKVVLAYVWGVCLAAVILLPSVYAFLQNGRSESANQGIGLLYNAEYYGRLWQSMTEPFKGGSNWSIPGTAAVGVVSLIILLVRRKKGEKRLILGFLVLGIMLCLPFVGSVMNGFSYVCNRWSYGMAFLLALISVFALSYLKDMGKKELLWVFGLVILYCIPLGLSWVFFWRETESAINTAVVFFTGAALAAAAWIFRTKRKEGLAWICAGITLAGVLWNVENIYGKEFKNYPGSYLVHGNPTERLDDSSLEAASLVEDESFYRIERHWDILNQALVEKVNTTGFYYSVVPGSMSELYKSVWLSSQERDYVLNSLDSRTALTSLASVKYYASDKETSIPYGYKKVGEVKGKSGKTHYLYENENALPLGYAYDAVMSREDYEKLSPLEREQTLLSAAVVEEPVKGMEQTSQAADCEIITKEVTVKSAEKVKVKDGKIIAKKGGTLTLSFEGEPDSETYLVLSGITVEDDDRDMVKVSSSAGNTGLKIFGETHHNHLGKEGEVLNLGYSSQPLKECTLTFAKGRTYDLENMEIQCVSMEDTRQQIEARAQESLEDVQVSDNRISGRITTGGSRVLQLSVPYSTGWKIYVDGEEADAFPSSIAYTGIYLDEGEHEIVAVYTSPWIVPGAILTICGVAAIPIYLWMRKRGGKTS